MTNQVSPEAVEAVFRWKYNREPRRWAHSGRMRKSDEWLCDDIEDYLEAALPALREQLEAGNDAEVERLREERDALLKIIRAARGGEADEWEDDQAVALVADAFHRADRAEKKLAQLEAEVRERIQEVVDIPVKEGSGGHFKLGYYAALDRLQQSFPPPPEERCDTTATHDPREGA